MKKTKDIRRFFRQMEKYKQEFIDFMVDADVLKFGDFTLKSGRKSPFFMNAGAYAVSYKHLLAHQPSPHLE